MHWLSTETTERLTTYEAYIIIESVNLYWPKESFLQYGADRSIYDLELPSSVQ